MEHPKTNESRPTHIDNSVEDNLSGSSVQILHDECCSRVDSGRGMMDCLALQQPQGIKPLLNAFGERRVIQTDVMPSFRTKKATFISLDRGALLHQGCNKKGITNNTSHAADNKHVQGAENNSHPSTSTLNLEHQKLDRISTKLDKLIKHFFFILPT